jgi:molecular chaperone DnaJ
LRKDYYKVLNLSPSASADEIRKAFRKLALLYHPDKNKTSSAQDVFREIKEAYEVLNDPVKRADYNYSRYVSGAGRSGKPPAQSPGEILHAAARLADKVSGLDPFRINLDMLSFEIRDILSEHNITILQQCNDPAINLQITHYLFVALKPLPLPVAAGCMIPLHKIALNDPRLQKELSAFSASAKWQYRWSRYKIFIALVAAILFAVILSLSGQ